MFDVVNVIIQLVKSKLSNEILNVGSGQTVSILKNYKYIEVVIKFLYKKRPGEPQITFANINKIKRKVRWKPKIKIEQGINLMLKDIEYWRKSTSMDAIKN